MAKRLIYLILLFCIILVGCSKGYQEDIEEKREDIRAKEYLIPNSFIEFNGSDKSEQVKSAKEKGDSYCTDAKETSDGMILYLTPEQKDNLVKDNNEFVDTLSEDFMSSNSEYNCLVDDKENVLSLYYDEKIDPGLQIKTILGIASMLAYNDILEKETTEWSVTIKIYNCHTNKEVVSVTIPEEEVSFGEAEWAESYNE